jgi:hypothetical protein
MGIHGVGGVVGTALAPVIVGGAASVFDWRLALVLALGEIAAGSASTRGRGRRRLLVTGSPPSGSEPGRMLAMRIERLVAMGDLDAAKAVVDHLPPSATDSVLARRAAEVALLLGDEQSACRLADGLGPTSEAEFWAEIAVYCRLVEDDRSAARLGLDGRERRFADTGVTARLLHDEGPGRERGRQAFPHGGVFVRDAPLGIDGVFRRAGPAQGRGPGDGARAHSDEEQREKKRRGGRDPDAHESIRRGSRNSGLHMKNRSMAGPNQGRLLRRSRELRVFRKVTYSSSTVSGLRR